MTLRVVFGALRRTSLRMRPLGMGKEVPGLVVNSFAKSSKQSRVPRPHRNAILWYSVMFDARSRDAFRSRFTFASVPIRWWFLLCSTGVEIRPSGDAGYNRVRAGF